MRRLAVALSVVLLTGHAGALQLSSITMRLDPVVPGDFMWNHTYFGLDTQASDAFDVDYDGQWPGPHPSPDGWILSSVPDQGGRICHRDYRDGTGGYADPALAEVWPYVFVALFGGSYKQGRLTWDLGQVGPYDYLLRDRNTGAEVAWLEPGGEIPVHFGLYGEGPVWTLEAYLIPEPGSLLMLGSALAAVVAFRRKAN